MKHTLSFLAFFIFAQFVPLQAAASDLSWVIQYDGQSQPTAPWAAIGKPNTKLADGALHLSDTSKDDLGAFEAEWKGDLEKQVGGHTTFRTGRGTPYFDEANRGGDSVNQ